MCEGMQVHVSVWRVSSTPFLGPTVCAGKAPWSNVEFSQDVLWWATPSGVYPLSSHVHPSLSSNAEGVETQRQQCALLRPHSQLHVTNSPPPPGPEQSSSCRAGGPKTFLLGPVSDTAAPTHLTVLHDGVVRRGLVWGWGAEGGADFRMMLSITGNLSSKLQLWRTG